MTASSGSRLAAAALVAAALALLPACGLVENAEAIVEHLERAAVESATDGELSTEEIAELTPWDELRVGDCIADYGFVDGELWYGMKVVDCGEPHYEELFLIVTHENAPFPGDDALFAATENACLAAFEDYVGEPYEDSDFLYSSYGPTEEAWKAGDRSSICLLSDYDYMELVGSVGEGTVRFAGS